MAENTLDPLTGLPYVEASGGDIDPLTGQPYTKSRYAPVSPLTGTVGMAGSFEGYDGTWLSPATDVNPFSDIDEQRARNQSTWDQWGNGLGKAGITFGGAVAENTVGYALGLLDYAASGFEDFEESMINNPIGKMVDAANEWGREAMPNYQTRQERSEQGTLAQLGNANFWADTFMNGAAYSLGSVASIYLTGGLGVIGAAGKAANVGGKLSKGLASYRAAKALQNGLGVADALNKGRKMRTGITRGSRALGYLEGGAMMSIAESAVEARETEDNIFRELVFDYKLEHGLGEFDAVPGTALRDMHAASQEMASLAFDANMAVLMPTNLLTFGNMLRPMQMGKNAIWGTEFTKQGGKKVLQQSIDNLPGWSARGAKFARTYASGAAKGAVTEGFQESSQYAISKGLEDFATEEGTEGLEQLGSVDMFKGFTNGRTVKGLGRILEGAAANINTPEGREQAMVGAMVGLVSGGLGGMKTNRAKDRNTKKAIDYFNKFDTHLKIKNNAQLSKRAARFARAMEIAEANNDSKAYNDAQFSLIREMAITHAQNGTFDAFIERLEDAKDLSQEDFNSLFGEKTKVQARDAAGRFKTVDQTNKERIDEIIERSKDLKANYEMIEDMYPSRAPKGALLKTFIRAKDGKKRLDELRQQDEDQNIYKNALVLSMTESKDSEGRALKHLEELRRMDPELNIEQILDLEAEGYTVELDETGTERIGATIQKELEKRLQESTERAKQNGHSVNKAVRHAQAALTLLANKNDAINAYRQLESSPTERQILVERQKAQERFAEQQRIDKAADDAITNTENYKDLVKAIEELDEDTSDSARNKAVAESVARRQKLNEFRRKFEEKRPEDVNNLNSSEMEPLEKEAWEIVKEEIKKSGRTEPMRRRNQNARSRTQDASNQRGTETPTGNQQESTEGDVRGRRGRARQNVDQTNALDTRTNQPDKQYSGEYNLIKAPDGKTYVQVDSEGNPVEGDRQAGHRLNGEPIIKGRHRLADPEINTETEVTLVAIENDWWRNEATEAEKNDAVNNLPIYVKIGNDIVGVLTGGHTALREAVTEEWKKGNSDSITTTIDQKLANNYFTAATSKMGLFQTPFFYNPIQSLGKDIVVGIVRKDERGILQYTIPEGSTEGDQIEKDFRERAPQYMAPGQVFFAIKDPHGKYRAAVASTANLNEADQQAALDFMKEGNLESLHKLVGTNMLYDFDGKVLTAQQAGEDVMYTFNAVDVNGQRDTNVPEGMFIQINQDLVNKALNNEVIELSDLTAIQRSKLLVNIAHTVTEQGIKVQNEIGVAPENPETAAYVAQNLNKLIQNIVKAKKYQVSMDALSNPGGYTDAFGTNHPAKEGVSGYMKYLTEGNQRSEGRGNRGILGTTTKSVKGSPFIDIGVTFSNDFKLNGERITPADTTPAAPSNPENTEPDTPSAPRPAVEQNPNDLLDGDTGPQVTPPNPDMIPEPEPGPEDIIGDDEFTIDPETGELIPATPPTSTVGDTQLDIIKKTQEAGISLDLLEDAVLKIIAENPSIDIDLAHRKAFFEIQKDLRSPFRYVPTIPTYTRLNKTQAKKWLKDRGIPTSFYDQAIRIGSGTVHGYMEQAGVNIWTQAELGTEYHESYHYIFRTLLNDKQRKALYTEARKKFDITKEELAGLKKLNPGLSRVELMELALEERMAEEFRDYVLTMEETAQTLPNKIRKFFKDLYNFIKALFINPVGMKQLYSLIESNRLPKKYLRNTEKFAGKATAYAYNEDIVDSGFHKEIERTLTTQFLSAYNELTEGNPRTLTKEETNKILGDKTRKGQVAEFFLKNAFRYADTKQRLSVADLTKVRNKIEAGQPIGALWSEINMEQAIPINTGLPQSLLSDPNLHASTAKWFRIINQNWFDVLSKDKLDNVLKFGFQTILTRGLEKYGFTIRPSKKRQDVDARDDANDEQTQFDKIYALGAMEFNPMDKATAEIRRLLANIKANKPNSLGMVTYINIDDIVRLVIPATAGRNSINEMIEAIELKSKNFPQLSPVVEALRKDFTEEQHAAFFNVFRNDYKVLKLVEEAWEDNNKTTRIINSNRKSAFNNAIDDWKTQGIEKQLPKPNAIFKLIEDKLQVNPEFEGQDRAELIAQAYEQLYISRDTQDRVRGLARALHYMGLNLGDTVEESTIRLGSYINTFEDPTEALNKLIEDIRPSYIIKSAFDLNIDKKTGALIPGKKSKVVENPINFFAQQSNRIKFLAEIKANFETPLAMSVISGDGKTKWPYNLPTPLNAVLRQAQGLEKEDNALNLAKMMADDEFFNTLGEVRYQSLLMRLVNSGKFEIESFALDVLKQEDEETSNLDYKKASARDSLIMRLEMYANGSNDFAYYALPTQETRGLLDFIKLPRFTSSKEMQKAGISDVSGAQAIIKGLIIQDLIRINRDTKVIDADESNGENLIQDYHTGLETYKNFQLTGVVNKKVGGYKLSELIDHDVLQDDVQDKQYTLFHDAVNKMVEEYLDKHVASEISQLEAKINDYNLNQEGKSRLPLGAIKKLGGLKTFLETFVINDITARLEMAKLFRGGISAHKSVTDFYKRMGLINTPGSLFMLKGSSEKNLDYGMFEQFNQATIDKPRILEAIHNEIVEDYKRVLIEQGVPADIADDIIEDYKTQKADAADGQAFILPSMWRAVKEGEGTFSKEDAVWYEKFEKSGKWGGNYIEPFKMYYEQQKLVEFPINVKDKNGKEYKDTVKQYVTDMDKNSWHVLTPEFVKDKPVLKQLYDKMIADNVHVVNTVSAKKGVKQNVMRLDPTVEKNIFNNLKSNIQQGAALRKPQTINDKKIDLVRLNRQIRKNQLNNVNRNEDYILNRGLDSEEILNGQDMLDEYHNSFAEIMSIQMEELKAELGYDKLMEANQANDAAAMKKARIVLFKKLRDLFYDETIKRDKFTENIEKQLQLVLDENGMVNFALPLAFPAYQDQYQGIFFSVFKNRVLKTMMNGKEVVQVASMGGMIEDENGNARELRYLSVETDEHGDRIVHAEVMINPSIAKKFGLKPGDNLDQVPEELLRAIGYRIPHQDKSSTLIMKVVGLLPKGYNKSIVVPGNITVMMGSDFDVDKLFVMFPEFAKASPLINDYAKVTVNNYESLKGEPGQNLRKAALQNRMLDIMEAISSSPLHFKESITPLDPTNLKRIIQSIDKISKMDVEKRPFDSPLKEIEMEENYKFSQELVGIYANMLAGMSVASAGANGTGVIVPTSAQFTVNGNILDRLQGTPETFKILVEHLSAALDAGNEILQPQLNDNKQTVGSKTFLYGIGMDPELVTMLHRTPMVMDFVKLVNIDGLSVSQAFNSLGISYPLQKLIKKNSVEKGALSVPMTTESLKNLFKAKKSKEGKYGGEALEGLKNFAISYYAGEDLQTFFKAITTDVLDGLGEIGMLQQLVESIESFDKSDNIFGAASVDQFLTGDAFGISKAFFTTFQEILTLSSDIFLGATPAVRNFKEQFKALTGKQFFSPEEHRAMDRSLFYWMMTQPGAPLNSIIAQQEGGEDPSLFMTSPTRNMATELDRMREKYPEEIGKNIFVMNLVPSKTNESDNNRIFNVDFESIDKITGELQNELTRAFSELLNPNTGEAQDDTAISNFGKRLIRHQLMSTGFTPGYGSYYNFIDVNFFTDKMKGQDQSAAQYSRAAIREVQQDPGYFNPAIIEIIRAIGTRNTKGSPMIPISSFPSSIREGVLTLNTTEETPAIIARKQVGKGIKVDKVQLWVKHKGNQYVLLNSTGITNQFNEINTGRHSNVSLAPNSPTKRRGITNVSNLKGFNEDLKIALETAGRTKSLEVISDSQNEQLIIERNCK